MDAGSWKSRGFSQGGAFQLYFNEKSLPFLKEYDIFSSLENGIWVDEEPYELVDFSPAVKTMRRDREAFESDFR